MKQLSINGGRLLLAVGLLAGLMGMAPVERARAQQDRPEAYLGILPTRMPKTKDLCLGGEIELAFRVFMHIYATRASWPIQGAVVSVGRSGGIEAVQTGPDGLARFSLIVDKEGPLTITVAASLATSDGDMVEAKPLTLSYNMIQCQWMLDIEFYEEYAVIEQGGWTVFGTATVQDIIGGSGDEDTYKGYYMGATSEDMDSPLGVSFSQPVFGKLEMGLNALYTGQYVDLEFRTKPVTLPRGLTWKFALSSEYQILKDLEPPALPVWDGNGRFLELNGLTQVKFPAEGGIITRDKGKPVFFYTPPGPLHYELSIRLKRLKQAP